MPRQGQTRQKIVRDGDVLRVTMPCGRLMLADAEDEELISAHFWYLAPSGDLSYARSIRRINGKRLNLGLAHRLIMQAPDDLTVDHINRNGLDNRKSNLRLCTCSQNRMNSIGRHRRRKSQYKGVTEYGENNRYWKAELKAAGDRYRVYGCSTDEEAAAYYDVMARMFHGEFALLNFPDGLPDGVILDEYPERRVSKRVKGAVTGRRFGVPQGPRRNNRDRFATDTPNERRTT